jgi:peptide/nickel transport system permease protein
LSEEPGLAAIALSLEQERAPADTHRWRRIFKNPRVAFGVTVLGIMILAALFAPVIAPYEANDQSPSTKNVAPFSTDKKGDFHLLGTDGLGRDIFSRLLYGARVSLLVGVAAVTVSLLIGVPLGLASGYAGGRVDSIIMRLIDIQLAIPFFLLAVTIAALLGQGLRNVILLLGATSWIGFARIVRAQVLSLRELPFVESARSVGVRPLAIVARHILPNSWTPIIVLASQSVGAMIVAESSLTFLGVGVPPDTATWGGMIAAGRNNLEIAWWISTIPGLALTMTVVAVYFLGDGLRDVLDPKMKR